MPRASRRARPTFLARACRGTAGGGSLPLLTNFEHQNLNAILLAMLAAATWQLTLGSALVAGALVGAATALKVFPALVIVYFIARRLLGGGHGRRAYRRGLERCRAARGIRRRGFVDLAQTFWRLSTSGWPVRGNNQSLIAAIDRLTSGANHAGVRVASEAPITMTVFVLDGSSAAMRVAGSDARATSDAHGGCRRDDGCHPAACDSALADSVG